MIRLFIITALLILALSASGQAEPPLPGRKSDLSTLQQNLEQEERRQKSLQDQLKDISKELDKTRSELVKIAKDIQDNEKQRATLEKRIEINTKEQTELTAKLEQDYGSIADLILALERMRRIPPESLIVRPGAPLETAQTAMLLQGTLPAVNRRVELLSKDLKRLGQLSKNLKEDKASVLATKQALEKKHASMKTLVDKREQLYSRTQSDYEQNKRAVARLSKEAKTLMDLINKLEKEQRSRPPKQIAYNTAIPNTGQARLPVTGYLIESFGQSTVIGSSSHGVRIQSQSGSLVVSPMGGIVRFAGNFKNYGNMVIIEHKNGYHSLVAGMGRVDAGVESRVKAGEPIGQMPVSSSRGGAPALYYELRYNGTPMDPANMFSELKS